MSVFQLPASRFTVPADVAAVSSLLPQPLNASAAPIAATVKNFFMLRYSFDCCSWVPRKVAIALLPKRLRAGMYQDFNGMHAQSGEKTICLRTFRGIFRSEEHTSELQSLMRISYD